MNSEEKRYWLFGVVNACPLNSPLDNCPFKVLREKSVAERWDFIVKISDKQVDDLIYKHKKCLFERESGKGRKVDF